MVKIQLKKTPAAVEEGEYFQARITTSWYRSALSSGEIKGPVQEVNSFFPGKPAVPNTILSSRHGCRRPFIELATIIARPGNVHRTLAERIDSHWFIPLISRNGKGYHIWGKMDKCRKKNVTFITLRGFQPTG